ncbi:MAG: tetratricopeptide repeat protein [Methanothrix sp.]|nr:tetratricopeptide repeat protein [Methanothrix sp.]
MKNGTPGISRADSWLEKGRELGRNSSCEEAVKAFDKAIELEPMQPMPEPRSLGIRNKPVNLFSKLMATISPGNWRTWRNAMALAFRQEFDGTAAGQNLR